MTARLYFDNAATSWPKPDAVYDAVDYYNRSVGVAVGRSGSSTSVEFNALIQRCRERCAWLFNAPSADRIVFTLNCTDSLNLAIHGILQPGDHVVTSVLEHNSVLRPLADLQARLNVSVEHIGVGPDGKVCVEDFSTAINSKTRLVVLSHASNVTGTIQPINGIGELARKAGALFLVDAAQTAGHVPIDVRKSPIDLLACAGHKGLMGPLGTGLLYVAPELENQIRSLRQGGTGSASESPVQPAIMPAKFEAGNHNAPGLCGLEAALGWLKQHDPSQIYSQLQEHTSALLAGIESIDGLHLVGAADEFSNAGVISIRHDFLDPHELSTILDEAFQIETRAGLHCAPQAHAALGTLKTGGTVRLSPGHFTTSDDVHRVVSALQEICGT